MPLKGQLLPFMAMRGIARVAFVLLPLWAAGMVHAAPPATPAATRSKASAPDEARPTRVLVMDFKAAGVQPELSAQATLLAAQALHGARGHAVMTMADLREVAGLEAVKALAGCGGEATCAAELAATGNVDLVVTGTLGRVGSRFTAALAVLDARKGVVRAREQLDAADAGSLARALEERMRRLLGIVEEATAAALAGPLKNVSMAVMDLQAAGVPADVAVNLTQVLGTEIRRAPGASVISREDIQAMLQLEQARMTMGCDDASCLAEIGGALGVEKLVVGSVGRLSGSHLVSLRLIRVRDGAVEARVSETYVGPEEQLIRAVRHAGRRLVGLQEMPTGSLAVATAQEGVEILVDGGPRGNTPRAAVDGLAAGPHAVELRKAGFVTWTGQVYVDPADTTVQFVNMEAVPLRWYQRWQVWTLAAGGASAVLLVAVATVAVVAAAGITGGIYVYRQTTSPPPAGGGTATIE